MYSNVQYLVLMHENIREGYMVETCKEIIKILVLEIQLEKLKNKS